MAAAVSLNQDVRSGLPVTRRWIWKHLNANKSQQRGGVRAGVFLELLKYSLTKNKEQN